MSAYICQPETFGILAAYAVLNDCAVYEWQHTRKNTFEARVQNAQRIAKGLARENIRSVSHRYPGDKCPPGPNLSLEDIEEAAAIYAAHFVKHFGVVKKLKQVEIFKIISCLDYQSCETDDWNQTLAYRQLDWIRGNVERSLPGYDDARWGYEVKIPEIEALYAKEKQS